MADPATDLSTGWANRIVDGTIHLVPPGDLIANPLNARRHPGAQRDALREALTRLGWIAPLAVNIRTGRMIDGHARTEEALATSGVDVVPVYYVDLDEDEERFALATLDPITLMATIDPAVLDQLIADIDFGDGALAALIADLDAQWPVEIDDPDPGGIGGGDDRAAALSLADRFGVPPFSVLDARQGYWQDRKRAWKSLGLSSELGRDAGLLFDAAASHDVATKMAAVTGEGGTSVFDPVLCELVYRWFVPPKGTVLDPFAGGSVRGVVAAALGRSYVGMDLSAAQVAANNDQWVTLSAKLRDGSPAPRWAVGDSSADGSIRAAFGSTPVDFVFSCPPYGTLEVYSDDPADLSTMDHSSFIVAYRRAIAVAVSQLAEDRFACFVVGDFRDKQGIYRNFVSDTIAAFTDAGCGLYNEAILVTQVGTVALTVARPFTTGRKLGKTHQNVLVFVKGDPKKAVAALGDEVEYGDPLAGVDAIDGETFTGPSHVVPATRSVNVTSVSVDGMRRVKVSAASARQEFAGCDPDYIRTTCHASCCRSSTSPTGTIITIHPSEEAAIRARGANVINGLLQPKAGAKRCPFQNTGTHLCDLHFTPDKPFGCIASPFTLTKNGQTLIIRNRYRSLKCYKDGRRLPAYVAFRASLDLIFGAETAQTIHDHLAAGGGDITVSMPARSYAMLADNDDIKHAAMATV